MNRKLVSGVKTTQSCPECGSRFLVSIGTCNLKLCTDCPTNIEWKRDEGQGSLYGGTEPDQTKVE